MRYQGWGRGRLVGRFALAALLIARRGPAQSVKLEIRPHAGDTLHMRLDQESELTAVKRTVTGDASAMIINTMKMFSRAIVETASEDGSTVLAVTDSVHLTTTDAQSRVASAQAEARMRGQRVRFRVAPDGTVSMDNSGAPAAPPREIAHVVSLMPAAFPSGPVRVGESWSREMPLPSGTQLGAQLSGRLHVTFRLDSLTQGGSWAFLSMRGTVRPAMGPGAAPGGLEDGVVDGTMVVDHRRGWLTESWFRIVASSNLPPPPGASSMRMQMRITQHMRAADRR